MSFQRVTLGICNHMRALGCAARSGVLWLYPYISSHVLNGRWLGFESNKSVFLLLPRIHPILCMTQLKRFSSVLLSYIIPREVAALVVSLAPGIFLVAVQRAIACRSTFTFHWASSSHHVVTYEYSLYDLFPVCPQVLIPELHFLTCRSKSSRQCGYFRHVNISHFTFHMSTGCSHTSPPQLILHKKVCLVFSILAPDDHLRQAAVIGYRNTCVNWKPRKTSGSPVNRDT